VWLAIGMSVPPLPDLDALSLDELKKLVVQLLVRVSALEEEIQQLRAENGRLKALPQKPKLAPGGMDKASEPDKRARTKQARRQRRKRQSGRRTPPVTEERTLVIEAPAGSRRRGFEPFTVQDLILTPQVIRFRRERWVTPDGHEIVAPLPPEVSGHFGPGTACCTEEEVASEPPFPAVDQATRTELGRPRSSIRLRTWAAMATSVARASSLWKRSPSPMTCFQRANWPSTPAL
jgi:hypothetical protein